MMLSGLVAGAFAALSNAARIFIGTWKAPRSFSIAYRGHALFARVCRFASAVVLWIGIGTALMPVGSPTPQRAPHTTASLLVMPEGRDVVVSGQRISREEVLWLARAIYSETKRPQEQELVAWVVRNRVETRYRGNATYKETVLDPYQFSAFNPNTPTRTFYVELDWNSISPGFQTALFIASKVAIADEQKRPFSTSTRHFYSARSMTNGKVPAWAEDRHPVQLDRPVDAERFRFYERIA